MGAARGGHGRGKWCTLGANRKGASDGLPRARALPSLFVGAGAGSWATLRGKALPSLLAGAGAGVNMAAPKWPPHIYRGWWVVSAAFFAAALNTGAGQYGFGIFIGPLEETFGWSRSQISASLSFTAFGSMAAPFLGRIMDRYGAKMILAASLGVIAASFALRPLMTELWHWYALSFLQYMGYTGAAMLPAGKLVGMWFHRTRGRAMGLTAMGHNFGGLTIPPLLGMILPLVSWRGSYIALGAIGAGLVVYSLITVRDFPSGEELREELDGTGAGGAPMGGWTLGEALRGRAFYAITLAVVLGTFTYAAILPQIITHLTDNGVGLGVASLALSVFAIMGMVGKFVMGYLAERRTSRYALMLNFVGQGSFLIAMIWAGNPLVMWTAVPLFGFFNGAFGALFQLVVQDAFGIRHFGSIMGVINLTTVISFGVGPIMAGASFDFSGSYTLVFAAVAVMFYGAALALTQAR